MIDSKGGGRGGGGGSLVPHPKHVMEMQSALSSGSSLGREVLVRDLVVSLCCVLGHFNLTVPLSTQEYKWVSANCQGSLMNAGRLPCDVSHPGEGTGG